MVKIKILNKKLLSLILYRSLNKIAKTLNLFGDGKFLNNKNPIFYSHTIKRILIDQGIMKKIKNYIL